MSSDTWQEIAALLALSPWVAFFVPVVWFGVLELRNKSRSLVRRGRRLSPDSSLPWVAT
jgi:hypothetical protein